MAVLVDSRRGDRLYRAVVDANFAINRRPSLRDEPEPGILEA
ncbi:MAG: hypothetical protein NXI31_23100 [bacterium]|nr:hypothetical protein [bacterium]